MAEIRVEKLHKAFTDFVAVRRSAFTVPDGDFFWLLGPSGCGKTTTLRMIAGLELPTSGRILLGGEDVTFKQASQRDIAFVFQLFALYPHMNVRANISYPLRNQGMPREEVRKRVEEAARILRITQLLDRSVSGLSSGDRQRVRGRFRGLAADELHPLPWSRRSGRQVRPHRGSRGRGARSPRRDRRERAAARSATRARAALRELSAARLRDRRRIPRYHADRHRHHRAGNDVEGARLLRGRGPSGRTYRSGAPTKETLALREEVRPRAALGAPRRGRKCLRSSSKASRSASGARRRSRT